jgi:hypothetical protein
MVEYILVRKFLIDCVRFQVLTVASMMMQAVCTTEMSVNIYLTTLQYIPEDPKLLDSLV